ncbi:pyridoxamine 5'-phosphate oxidase family protein [Aquimarina sp. W85]|uniref:pyridoxamine 5'-phosphate oxidase family protein n=1 Tax=Aquimarina rhodophyticola TaxID=3342246 RepID=UPI00366B9C6C
MIDLIFKAIQQDLKTAITQKDHPFRYFALATNDSNNIPHVRTVVLRDLDTNLHLYAYTDKRSKKITHLQQNQKVSLLFLDRNRFIQLSIKATAHLVTDPFTLKKIWEQIPDPSKKDYTTQQTPGETLKDPTAIDYLETKHFFTALKFIPDEIEYLRLKRPNHIRVQFKLLKNEWKGVFIAP